MLTEDGAKTCKCLAQEQEWAYKLNQQSSE
jgi:hypothetical protein